ncbi:ankyrin repeat domain-containing protein SOWAHC [Candoia aspera]|uniref:ankyrin repeat domain-containing protein SOWAHC n=1 Tax=Candoia aspera TaxID=51853 RepID=UPI002FD7B188
MAASGALDHDAVLRFLAERGGRARNADLLEHFRGFLTSPDPQRRARDREHFKELVNAVATVRQEPGSGAKYVQLRKRYRGAAGGRKPEASAASLAKDAFRAVGHPEDTPRPPGAPRSAGEGDSGDNQDGGAAREEESGAEPLKEEAARGDPSAALGEPPPEESDSAAAASEGPPEAPSPGAPEAPRTSPESPGGEGGGSWEEERSSPPCLEAAPTTPSGDTTAGAEEKPSGNGVEALLDEDSPPSTNPGAGAPAGGASTGAHTPRCGHKIFRERMLGSSPQLKRGGLLHRGGNGVSRGGDSDSASLASSSAEDESGSGGGSVALDPLEHAWMLCASDGHWESLESLLSCEPALLAKRDFITGFTCLHWAAKLGHPELLARLVNFAHRQRLPININARTSGGYTALHLAAMHGHLEVVKLLVGAYDADVDIRDYSGRKASHYLSRGTAEEVRSLVGALQDEVGSGAPNGSSRWRLSKVLPTNLISYKLSHHHHGDERESGDGSAVPSKSKELGRKALGSGRIKPRLNKIRFHTQIIHTTPSFRGDAEEEEERSMKASFKLRPKSNIFG